ncbi:NPC intracellular cholesterol transporter 1-like [Penaeus japonicus]|uniref:NPC intracellular cholesterol transporter 1-like n=1 Tax=Penaeus japonicus TaxID=27405 RepID=UPI001C7133BB|nr:NPC intracellular cholesterol transporter 1-like [Penaeus japonicus]
MMPPTIRRALWGVLGGALVLLLGAKAEIPEDGHCIWYGLGDRNPERPDLYLNSAYEGPAKPLTDSVAVAILTDSCPELVEEIRLSDGSIKTCCDLENIRSLAANLGQLENILRTCPTCFSNLRKSFCYSACHPKQSSFLLPTLLYETETQTSILSVNFLVHEKYTHSAYASCENVYFPSLGVPALDVLCGDAGSRFCTPEKLFSYFGNNAFTPFNTTYVWASEDLEGVDNIYGNDTLTLHPFDVSTTPCNTSDPAMHCLCSDCLPSCPSVPELPPPTQHKEPPIVSVDALTLSLALAYAMVAAAVITASCFWSKVDRRGEEQPDNTGDPGWPEVIAASVAKALRYVFSHLGRVVALCPLIFLALGLAPAAYLAYKGVQLKLTTDPMEVFASSSSKAMQDKLYFESHFGPVDRTARLIVTPKNYDGFNVTLDNGRTFRFGPALNDSFLLEVMALQGEIEKLSGSFEGQSVGLKDVCVKPMDPQGDDCLIHSVLNYWQNDPELLQNDINAGIKEFAQHFISCASDPSQVAPNNCLGSFGGPVPPYTSLGGFLKEDEVNLQDARYSEATALVITLFLEPSGNETSLGPVLEWEKAFLTYLKEKAAVEDFNRSADIAFYAAREVEDEHLRESSADVTVFLAGCVAMLAYAGLALGRVSAECRRTFIDSKLGLTLGVALVVAASIVVSAVVVSYLGIATTVFVVEVLPFWMTAVGVGNLFLLVQTWQREPRQEGESVEDHVGRVVGKVAPSMLLSTCAEALCFFLAGRFWSIGIISSFAYHVALATVIGFLLQLTCFVALLALDARRIESNTWDLCCVIRGEATTGPKEPNVCYVIFEQLIGPFIFKDMIRLVVLLLFTGVFFASVSMTTKLEIGMERNATLAQDSFLHKFFKQQDALLAVGPPVYFVMTEGYNFTDVDEQNLVCQMAGCRDDSVLQVIGASSRKPETTYLATSASSWISSYFTWLRDFTGSGFALGACCRLDADGNFIDTSDAFSVDAVATCLQPQDFVSGRPRPSLFMTHLEHFLSDNPHGSMCPVAGHVSFGDAVRILEDQGGDTSVGANHFMAYSARLRSSQEHSSALNYAQKLGENFTRYLQENSKFAKDVEVFPHSSFYVYYEQYLTMWADTGVSLGVSVASVFAVMFLLTFDLASSLIILLTIVMIVVDMMGVMYWWNISLNAVSLVNLVMAVGVSVEFCCHITYAFGTSRHFTKLTRAQEAQANMGSSVFAGITLTMACGIAVLQYVQSQMLRVICLPMFSGMLVIGASHGLVFLPVLLSVCGPKMNRVLANEKRTVTHPEEIKNIGPEKHVAEINTVVITNEGEKDQGIDNPGRDEEECAA